MCDDKNLMETRVFMSNPIFEAKRKMNIFGERIFKIGLAHIKPHIEGQEGSEYDTEFHEVLIPYSKLREIFGYDAAPYVIKKAVRNEIDQTVKGYIERKSEDGWEDSVPLYAYIGYKEHVGLRFKFNDVWKKDLINLVKDTGFSSYKLKEVFDLSSVHSVRLMELMQMKAGHFKEGKKEVYNRLSIDFLRNVLTRGGYEGRNDNFKRVIINQAVKEINEKTRYNLRYENIKEGRKVVGYNFIMEIKEGYEDCEDNGPIIDCDDNRELAADPYSGLSAEEKDLILVMSGENVNMDFNVAKGLIIKHRKNKERVSRFVYNHIRLNKLGANRGPGLLVNEIEDMTKTPPPTVEEERQVKKDLEVQQKEQQKKEYNEKNKVEPENQLTLETSQFLRDLKRRNPESNFIK